MKKIFLIAVFLHVFTISTAANDKIVNPHEVYTYKIMAEDIQLLKERYKEKIKIKSIGKSHFGKDIWAIKLGNSEENILMVGSHHGREWITTSLLMKMIEEYAASERKMVLLNEMSIWFVPMLNPDGVTIQQGNLDQFSIFSRWKFQWMNEGSSHFSRWKANAMGVDLNRQYPAGWSEIKRDPRFPSYQFYKGKKTLQAKEAKAIVNFTKKIRPTIAVAYHSSGREIFWKYKNGKNVNRDRLIAEKVSKITKYPLSEPPKKAIGAGYTDWFISTLHRPALTIEICPLVEETNPPLSVFNEEWDRNKNVGILLIQEGLRLLHN